MFRNNRKQIKNYQLQSIYFCDKKQNDFADLYLVEYKDGIIYKCLVTDIS